MARWRATVPTFNSENVSGHSPVDAFESATCRQSNRSVTIPSQQIERHILRSCEHLKLSDLKKVIMADSLNAPDCAVYMKALGDPIRLQIIEYLQDGPQTVTSIAEHIDGEIAKASHHLQILSHAGLVMTEKDGKFSYYSLASDVLVRDEKRSSNSLEFGCCRLELGRKKAGR